MSLIEELLEDARAADAAVYLGSFGPDVRYWQDLGYAFVLHVGSIQTRFPLVLAPTRYEKTLPFSRTITPGQEGGKSVERQGIIVSKLLIAGHTGVKPRTIDGLPVALSGQAHFLRLQNACFDEYSRLCQDPTVSSTVRLTFHSFRDNEHFLVEPDTLRLPREAQRRVHYPYEMTFDILGVAEAVTPKAIEDDNVLASFKDAASQIFAAAGRLRGFLDDVTNLHDEIGAAYVAVQSGVDAIGGIPLTLETNVAGDLERVSGVLNEFNRGVTRIINLPVTTILDIADSVGDLNAALARSAALPADVVQGFRNAQDALFAIAAHPEKFTAPWDVTARAYTDLTRGPGTTSSADLAAASPATSTSQLRGSGVQPGDSGRVSSGAIPQDRTLPGYQGFREYIIRVEDSLAMIAARELGDARRWADVAIANGLRAPFIGAGFPNCVGPGDKIVIPTLTTGVTPDTVASSGDVLGASQLEALFGTDWLMVQDVDGFFDFVIDVGNGGTDLQKVSGLANVEQAINIILATERGTNPLYLLAGVPATVGKKGTFNRLINAQLDFAQGLLRDPRIEKIGRTRFVSDRDTVAIDMAVTLISKIQTRTVARVGVAS